MGRPWLEDEQEEGAAIRIQSVYRGWKVRACRAEDGAISRAQGFSSLRPRVVTEVQVSAD